MATIVNKLDRDTSNAGIAAIDTYAGYLANDGSGLIKALRPMLEHYKEEDAGRVLLMANEAAKTKRPNWEPAALTEQRISAMKGLWKAYEWKSWPVFLTQMEPTVRAMDDLIMLCNWFRSKDLGHGKTDVKAPTVEKAHGRLKELADKRAAAKEKSKASAKERKALGETAVAALTPLDTYTDAVLCVNALLTLEGKGKGKAFLEAARKGLESYKEYVSVREVEATLARETDKIKKRAEEKAAKALGK